MAAPSAAPTTGVGGDASGAVPTQRRVAVLPGTIKAEHQCLSHWWHGLSRPVTGSSILILGGSCAAGSSQLLEGGESDGCEDAQGDGDGLLQLGGQNAVLTP